MREVDGFILEADAIQPPTSAPYFDALVRVRRIDGTWKGVHSLHGKQFHSLVRAEALAAAEAFVLTVVAVNHHGQPLDRPVT